MAYEDTVAQSAVLNLAEIAVDIKKGRRMVDRPFYFWIREADYSAVPPANGAPNTTSNAAKTAASSPA